MADWDWGLVHAHCLREAVCAFWACQGQPRTRRKRQRSGRGEGQASCQTPDRPQPWVATIARNEALRIAARPGFDPLDAASEPAEDSHEDDVLGQADMDPGDRRPVVGPIATGLRGRYWDDLDYRQLGRLLHVPEGTVRVRHHRALARLRQAMGGT